MLLLKSDLDLALNLDLKTRLKHLSHTDIELAGGPKTVEKWVEIRWDGSGLESTLMSARKRKTINEQLVESVFIVYYIVFQTH